MCTAIEPPPDIADAFVMSFGMQPAAMSWSTLPYDDSGRQEIARRNGWEYSGETSDDESYSDRRTWNHPGRNDDNFDSGFGGVHSIWLWIVALFRTLHLMVAATPTLA